MKIKIIAIAALLIVLANTRHAVAQEADSKLYNYSIGVQPLYFLNGGMRIDLEKRLNDRQILQVGAIGYLLPERDDSGYWDSLLLDGYASVNKLTGAGLALDHKWFLFPRVSFMYLSAGVSYNYYNMKYNGTKHVSYMEDGLTFYETRYGEITQVFNKIGGNTCFGIQTPLRRPFYVDGYVGLGYSHSFYDENKLYFNANMFNVGYRGITFVMGARVGYRFGR